MLDLFLYAALAGFIVATPVGLTQLIAFERTLNRTFKSGWKVAMGATLAHAIYATLAVMGIYFTSEWIPFDKLSNFILAHKFSIICFAGLLIMLTGRAYLRKKTTEQHKLAPETGFLIGLSIPLLDIGNLATHTAAVSTTGVVDYSLTQGVAVVCAVTLGAHLSWAWKLGFVYFGKRQLKKRNVENLNRVFGWFMVVLGGLIFTSMATLLVVQNLF